MEQLTFEVDYSLFSWKFLRHYFMTPIWYLEELQENSDQENEQTVLRVQTDIYNISKIG